MAAVGARLLCSGNRDIGQHHKTELCHFGGQPGLGGPQGKTERAGFMKPGILPSYVPLRNFLNFFFYFLIGEKLLYYAAFVTAYSNENQS